MWKLLHYSNQSPVFSFMIRHYRQAMTLAMYAVLISPLILFASAGESLVRDDLGACIGQLGFKSGVVSNLESLDVRRVATYSFEGVTCSDWLSVHDYNALQIGDVVFYPESSSFIHKIWGVNTLAEFISFHVYIALICIVACWVTALFIMTEGRNSVIKEMGRFKMWALGDTENDIPPRSSVPIIPLGLLSIFVFLFSGLADSDIKEPFIGAIYISSLAYSCALFMSFVAAGRKHWIANFRAFCLGATVFVVIEICIFHWVLGMDLSQLMLLVLAQAVR